MGGDWHDLGGTPRADPTTMKSHCPVAQRPTRHGLAQPLAGIHDTPERAWAADWIVDILAREGVAITPEVKEHLWSALTSLASAPVDERTLTGLAVLLQSDEPEAGLAAVLPRRSLRPAARRRDRTSRRGIGSGLRDRRPDRHRRRAAPSWPISSIASRAGSMAGPRCSSSTRAGLRSTTSGFAGQLREWLKTLRKKNASVVFATQSLSDIDG